ncbi:ABC-three component system protein [Paucisalibacillus globulus]|uniref:ABC-three component system protein n=1 Tax=Paucisalibacillus globulus TaxID=351095 RepID=UPI0003FF7FA5|nr:ABC-three component system protein [Paucisalibacillus globulus]
MQSTNMETNWTNVACASAASSWNGYTYQGKVAVYTMLCLINQLGARNEDVNFYSLEIELFEDFSIKYDNQYFSIHQVKSYQDKKTIGGFKATVLELLGKCLIEPTVKEASLHTAINIKDFAIKDIITDLIAYEPDKKKDLLNHFKKLLFDENKFNEAWDKLKINVYNGEVNVHRVVQVDEINDKIKEQIKIFLQNDIHRDSSTISSENIDYAYSNLLHTINNLIADIHMKKQTNPIITFTEVLKILQNDSVFNLTNETVASLLMDDLTTYFEEYCEEQEIDLELDDEKAKIWTHHIDILKLLSPEDFVLICRKIAPNISIKKSNSISITEYKRLMDQHGVKQMLFECIFTFHHLLEAATIKNDILLIKKSKASNLITLILNQGKNACSKVGKDIFNNFNHDETLLELLFEVETYINKSINEEYTGTITDVESDTDLQNKEKFTGTKRIKFMDINTAMEEFKPHA